MEAAAEAAHNAGKKITAHAGSPVAISQGIRAGLDCVEHGYFLDDPTIELMVQRGTYLVPTLSVSRCPEYMRERDCPEWMIQKSLRAGEDHMKAYQDALAAGVKIAMGTDMGFEPDMGSNAAELEIYVKLGMKPMDAILTTTRNAAQALKQEKDLGTIEAGKLADVIAVDGDPLKNIRCLQEKKNIRIVMKEGRIYADRRPGKSKNVVNVKPGDWKIIDYL
jgi:imidazolonepropionase-like amidohydrolase